MGACLSLVLDGTVRGGSSGELTHLDWVFQKMEKGNRVKKKMLCKNAQ